MEKHNKILGISITNLKTFGIFQQSSSIYFFSLIFIIDQLEFHTISWIISELISANFQEAGQYLSFIGADLLMIKYKTNSIFSSGYLSLLVFCTIMIIGIFLLGLVIIFAINQNKVWPQAKTVFFHAISVFVFVLQIPTFNSFICLILESLSDLKTTPKYALYAVLGTIGILMTIILIFVYSYLSPPLKTEDPACRLNNTFIFTNFFNKLLLSLVLLLSIWSGTVLKTSILTFIVVLNLLASARSTYVLMKNSPFIEKKIFLLVIFCQASILAVATSNLIQLFNSKMLYYSPRSHPFQSMIFMVLFSKLMLNWKERNESNIFSRSSKNYTKDPWFNLSLYSICKNSINFNQEVFYANGIKETFDKIKLNIAFKPKDLLLSIVNTGRDLQGKLVAASILFEEFGDSINASIAAEKIITNPFASLSLKIGAVYLLGKIENKYEKINQEEPDRVMVENFFFFEKSSIMLKKNVLEFLDAYISFFKLLNQDNPVLNEIKMNSKNIQAKYNILQTEWKKIGEKFDKLPSKLLRTFAIFHNGIKIKSKDFQAISSQFITAGKSKQKNLPLISTLVERTDVVYVYVSLQPNSIGNIISISSTIRNVLGYSPALLQGKNVATLHPRFIADINDVFFRLILASELNPNLVWQNKSLMLNKEGDLISVDSLAMISNHNGQELCLGLVVTPSETQDDILLLDEKGKVVAASKNYKPFLKFDLTVDISDMASLKGNVAQKLLSLDLSKKIGTRTDLRDEEEQIQNFLSRLENMNFSLYSFKIGPHDVNCVKIEEIIQINEFKSSALIIHHIEEESVDHLAVSVEHDGSNFAKYLSSENGYHQEDKVKEIKVLVKRIKSEQIEESQHTKKTKIKTENFNGENSITNIFEEKSKSDQNDQQSIFTSRSERTKKRFENRFSDLQQKMSFSKFYQIYFLFAVYIAFLVLNVSTIFISYAKGKTSSEDLYMRVNLVVMQSERSLMLSQLIRGVWADQYLTEFLARVTTPAVVQQNLQDVYDKSVEINANLPVINSQIETEVNKIDDEELKSFYYMENIKMFYGDFENALTSNQSIMVDNFKAANKLYSAFNDYFSYMFNKTKNVYTLRKELYANVYNDLFLVYEKLDLQVLANINSILTSTKKSTDIIYIACFLLFGIYLVTLLIVLKKYYTDTAKFLSLFPNNSYMDTLSRIDSLEKLKIHIESDSKKDFDAQNVVVKKGKREAKNIYKNSSNRSLFNAIFVKRIILFAIFIIPSIIMLIVSYQYTGENQTYVNEQITNIYKLNMILTLALRTYHANVLNLMYFNNFIMGNTFVRNFMDILVSNLGDSVSLTQNFSPEIESMLSENLCNYYNDADNLCDSGLKGIGKQGARALIYASRDIYVDNQATLKEKGFIPQYVLPILLSSYGREMYELTIKALAPAVKVFIQRIGSSLLSHLDGNLDDIIRSFWIGLVVNVMSFSGMIVIIFKNVKRERIMVAETINFVPLDFVMRNNSLRLYLIKENREFNNLFKSSEMMQSISRY